MQDILQADADLIVDDDTSMNAEHDNVLFVDTPTATADVGGLKIWTSVIPAAFPGRVPGAGEKAIRERLRVKESEAAALKRLEAASSVAGDAVSWYLKRETLRTGKPAEGLEVWLDPSIIPKPRADGRAPGDGEKAVRQRLMVKMAETERARAGVEALMKMRAKSTIPQAYLALHRHREKSYVLQTKSEEEEEKERMAKEKVKAAELERQKMELFRRVVKVSRAAIARQAGRERA
ncbi:hypothetical protein C8R46DRAFT_1232104 [Mycena filopes]|nr:hypothetical protein C8R46DRAFT_1232104 [Mycena filopes]